MSVSAVRGDIGTALVGPPTVALLGVCSGSAGGVVGVGSVVVQALLIKGLSKGPCRCLEHRGMVRPVRAEMQR